MGAPADEKRYKIYIERLRKSHLGLIPWNKGKKTGPLSDKHKQKISDAHKGKLPKNFKLLHSSEMREKARLANRGKRRSEKTRKKMSQAQMDKQNSLGIIPWNKGKTAKTDERVRRMTEAHKGQIPWNKGKTGVYSKKTLKNILRRRTPSSLEKKFQKIIDEYHLPYKYVGDGAFIIGHYNPDFINTNDEKIAVEVYARYYKLKNNETIEQWKEKRNRVFARYDWRVIYFEGTQIEENKILEILKGKSP